MKTIEEKIIEYNGMNIYYYTKGDSKNDAIVMLHPAFSDHEMFIEQIKYFSDSYYVIVFDMVSQGKSVVLKTNNNMGHMPEIIERVLEKEKVLHLHLLGVSLGSLVAQAYVDKYSQRVKSVTIVGGYSIHKANKHLLKAQMKEGFKWIVYILFSMKKFKNYVINNSVRSTYGKEIFRKGIDTFTRSSFRGMAGMNTLMRDDEAPVQYPLLIICGEFDINLSKDASKNLSHLEPTSNYIEIKDAGHCAQIDKPSEFNKIFNDFIHAQ